MSYGVILETLKECFLVVRHGKNSEPASADGTESVPSDNPMFTISLIQGEVETTGGLSMSITAPTAKSEEINERGASIPRRMVFTYGSQTSRFSGSIKGEDSILSTDFRSRIWLRRPVSK